MDPAQPGPAQQESTLPAYRTQAHAWEEPSDTWVNAANQDADNQWREWNRQQGRGTPPAENPNQWDYETMTPEQAAAAAAAAETWRQPPTPAQPSTYAQSYQNDQSQGYTAGMTLSPEQAAYFSQEMAGETGVDAQQAYDQAQALSAVHFPGTDFQGQFQTPYSPTGAGTYSGITPQNPVAGHAHDSLAPLNRANPDGRTAGLNRSAEVRRSTRGWNRGDVEEEAEEAAPPEVRGAGRGRENDPPATHWPLLWTGPRRFAHLVKLSRPSSQ